MCVPHTIVEGCKTYDNTNDDSCSICKDEYFLMTQRTNCVAVDIEGCDVFDSAFTCSSCKDGYD